jgi:hypothetical protein
MRLKQEVLSAPELLYRYKKILQKKTGKCMTTYTCIGWMTDITSLKCPFIFDIQTKIKVWSKIDFLDFLESTVL